MEIPDWVLFEVLLRLPLNSVVKCRMVSKQWLSLASDPYFIRTYANSRVPSWIVLPPSISGEEKFLLPTFVHNPPWNHRAAILLPPHRAEHLYIAGVSNGLVLYFSPSTRLNFYNFYVCNPTTGHRIRSLEHVELLSLSADWIDPSWGFLTNVDGDFTLRSYRIVYAMHSLTEQHDIVIIFYIYYSETGRWKRFAVPFHGHPRARPLKLQASAAILNNNGGILHWADTRRGGMVVYDPEANPEKIRFIRDPEDVEEKRADDDMWDMYLCEAYRGGEELRYFGGHPGGHNGFPAFRTWKLVGSGEWGLEHKIEITDIPIDIYCRVGGLKIRLEIVCFDPLDSDVVHLIDLYSKCTFAYNMKSKTLVDCDEIMMIDVSRLFGLFGKRLLVVPPWPTRVAEELLEWQV